MSKQIIILGCYRSGTSMLGNILFKLGIDMGYEADGRKADKYNKNGYFECGKAVEINHNFILQVEKRYTNINKGHIKKIKDFQDKKIKEYIDFRNKKDIWGLKDPRIVPFWSIWEKYFNNALPIIIRRNPDKVASSLSKKDKIPKGKSLEMSKSYNEIFEEVEKKYNCLSLKYDNILINPEKTVKSICEYLKIDKSDDEIKSVSLIIKK